jgi:hypothetical protein
MHMQGFLHRMLIGLALAALLAALLTTPIVAARQGGDDLPDGDGKKILLTACTACHDLKEVTKFRGFYTKDEWRDIVNTMVEYGATLKEGEAGVLVDYLARTLGKPSAAPQ